MRQHRRLLLTALCLLVLSPLPTASAAIPVKTVAHYNVSSMGVAIGTVTTTQRMTEEGGKTTLDFESTTAVKASFLWLGYSQDITEKGTLQKHELISYSRKGHENGVAIDVEGRLEHSSFRFDVHERGTRRTIVIPRSSYDCTTMECPEARLDFNGKPEISLKVLDVEKMAVVKRDFRLVRTAHYTVDGKSYPCRIVDFTDRNKKARRWITWDGAAALLYRQDGKSEKNSYSAQATSVTREM